MSCKGAYSKYKISCKYFKAPCKYKDADSKQEHRFAMIGTYLDVSYHGLRPYLILHLVLFEFKDANSKKSHWINISAGSYPEMNDNGILCVGSSAAEWGRNPREVSSTLTRHR